VDERKPVTVSWLLQVVDMAEGMVNVPYIDSINNRKLHVLYVIGRQKYSVLKRGGLAE
jgi:hypothetical protein